MAVMKNAQPPLTEEAVARFWLLVEVGTVDQCWFWQGHTCMGYGVFSINPTPRKRLRFKAHQVSYLLATGVWPVGQCVCHSCDKPACCNPSHLWAGSDAENLADCKRKGRKATGDRSGARTKPEKHVHGTMAPHAKLTDDIVREMRKLYATGLYTYKELGLRFGVHWATASHAISRLTWKHVA